jgi:hypothetical protein
MPNQEAWVFCVVGNIEDSGKIVAGRFNKQVGLEPEAMGEVARMPTLSVLCSRHACSRGIS